jgi:2-methylcitrate dehydratase
LSSHISNERPEPDKVLTDIADYALSYKIDSDLAYSAPRSIASSTRWAAASKRSNIPACTKLLGPIVPGTIVPNGARVPGTNYQLDPVQAAFNIGAMIRWLDFNDTWLAAEWGHPSDNLGGILATADWLSRTALADGRPPLPMRDVLTAMIKAHEIQGCIALENSFNKVGLDHVVLVKVASTAVVSQLLGLTPRPDHRRALAGVGRWAEPAHLSPRAQHRLAQELGRGRRHQPRCASGADGAGRRDGLPLRAHREDMGLLRRFVQRPGVSLPAALRQLCDGERAVQDQLSGRVSCADRGGSGHGAARASWKRWAKQRKTFASITIRTHEACLRIIDKKGPLANPADRDHCVQYMIAIPLLFGRLTAADYEDWIATDPRIDACAPRWSALKSRPSRATITTRRSARLPTHCAWN